MKLTPDLRDAVLNKLWQVDGEDKPARKPATWEEVGDCCEMELQTRVDAHVDPNDGPAGDELFAMGGGTVLPPDNWGEGGGGRVRFRKARVHALVRVRTARVHALHGGEKGLGAHERRP